MSRYDQQHEPAAGTTPHLLSYRTGPGRTRPWRDAVHGLAGFFASVALSSTFHYLGARAALRGGVSPLVTACLTLTLGTMPLIYFEITGKGLDYRGRWAALLPAALVGWGLAALVEGVCFASMSR